MFGSSSPFGQSASTPFGSQSPFGQNNVTNNPFAPKPFGAANPFGSQTGGSVFGSTSTGVFGQSSSPLSSTPTFGATPTSGFGNTPTFGSQSSSFGGSSTFGGFGTGTQPSPLGSSFQQSQPAFSTNLFGASSQPSFGTTTSAFGSSTTPTFGSTSTGGFGATSASAFRSTPSPSFGNTGAAFGVGSAPAFGSTGAFRSSNNSVFGAGSAPAFGATTSSAFGATSTPTFGPTSTPAFGQPNSQAFGSSGSAPTFGASTTSAFSLNSSPAFGQSTSTFGNTTFGSTPSPFGTPASSASTPFGSQSPFGQNNVTNNPFAPKPFGAANPFGSQTGGSVFGSTSTGVFGQSSSPLSSTPTFGATPTSGFGNTPTFGSQSSSFGGSSTFGGFGTGTQPSPFGSSFQQSQPAFSTNLFGASSQPSFGTTTSAFGSSTTPTFGSTSTGGFGATSASAFGSTPSPSFGNTGAAFGVGSAPAFGSTGAFGSSNNSVFGAGSAPAFGATTSSAFGATSTPTFGATSTPAFGQPNSQAFGSSGSAPTFGASTTSAFSFNSSPAFGQSTSTFGNSTFGSTPSPFGTPASSGVQTTTPTFGSGTFGQSNLGGSRVAPYQATADTDGPSNQPQGKLESISAMQVYKDKSHEELRWEDYQRGDKGGPNAAGQSSPGLNFGVPGAAQNPFGSPTLGQSSANPFSTSTPSTQSNIFSKPSPFGGTGLGTSTPTFGSSPFGSAPAPAPTSNLFGSSPAQTSSPFGTPTPAFSSSSIFGSAISSATTSASIFGATPSQTQSPFGTSVFGSQPSPLFQSSSPSLGIGSTFGQSGSLFGSTPSFSSAFNTTSTFPTGGFGNTSNTTGGAFGQSTSQPPQQNSLFNFNNAGQTQAGGASGIFGQSLGQSFGQSGSGIQNSTPQQPIAITNPFGTLPAMPHMSIGNTGTSPSIQYGISSMPVVDKPTPVRVSSLLTSRHTSQRRIRLPARKYHPKNDGSRVAFFSEEDEAPSTPKADALFIPRENPRSLIIRPIDQWPKSSMKEASVKVYENGNASVENHNHINGSTGEGNNGVANGNGHHSVKFSQKPTGNNNDDTPNQKGDSYITLSGHRAGEAAIVYEHGADIEATMPKLRHSDYYTEPRIQELAAKERAEPGYCRHVKDFVVGRHNYGSIKFLGETDVRRLDLESLIQFNNREVIVYLDDSKKPPVGQGLNKPAEVTLLNIKCYDKKRNQIIEGPKIEKYKEMLKKKAEDQGAEFLSYDPAKGEWKFRVDHFSKYVFGDDDQWDTD
ncbi:nuclear pore complex protein NUP98A-like isoform X2 [Silene latifolia]|uniref:nuclear pore complex protein NUP98A-like isoform X2 n=1 Tax=Silene latifolia TaxID=37657 RepID=UPI003D771F94